MLQRVVFGLFLLLCWPLAGICQGLALENMAVLVDPAGTETLASVTSQEAAGRFRPLANGLNAGYTRKVHWLRFTVRAPSAGEWWLEVQPPFLDDIRLYEPLPGNSSPAVEFRERRGGDHLPFAEREIPYRAFVARLALPDTQPRTFYLRVQTSSASMTFLRLWRPAEFQQAVGLEYVVLGLFYGLLTAVLITNLIQWLWLRDTLYIYFSLYVLALILLFFGVNGFAAQFLFANNPDLASLWRKVFLFLTFSAAAPFFMRMLRVDARKPWLLAIYRLQLVVPLLLLPLLFSGYFTEAARLLMATVLPMGGLCLWLGYGIWHQGRRDGMYVVASLTITLLGAVLVSLSLLGLLPGELWALDIRQITMFGSILAMHIAVATRIRDTESAHRAALIRVEEEARAKNEHRQFIGMLTHEICTPLAVIDGAVQSLEYLQQPRNEEVQLRHRRIRSSVGRINGLVKQFLANDRIDDARLFVHQAPLDAAELAHQAAQSCAEGRLERIILNTPPAILCRGDAALVQLALSNLLDNALKYSPSDSAVEFRVEALTHQDAAGVAWTVADHGSGIAAEQRKAVFDKYVRGADHGNVAGTGLGLYLVRRIAELHGGSVEILEREGWGAVLRFWLPQNGEVACSK
ncbi:MAG: sensor histidine kinase [Gallionella sp.]|jgi:signal transduction histidine kinase|nr:sensor histidine kinase [Gallionella sp.]MCK9354451.1 sensor histidine kinase [Gallionella sp.]